MASLLRTHWTTRERAGYYLIKLLTVFTANLVSYERPQIFTQYNLSPLM